MAKYNIEITVSRVVEVEAENEGDARGKIYEMWRDGKIVIDGTNFSDLEIMEVD